MKVDEKRRYRQAKDISEEANSRYKQLKREVQQQIKKDKEDWFNEECATLEKLDATHASRQFFQKVKGLNKKLTPRTRNIKAKDGTLLTETKEIKERWKEFTEELYCNTDKNPHPTIVTPSGSEEPSILLEEVEEALRKIKHNKSPGTDGIPAELL